MSEEPTPQRQRRMSPEGAARRAERLLVAPFREQIAELQTRVAFIAARSVVGKSHDPLSIDAEYAKAKADIENALTNIDQLVSGNGLGPAEDCRRALRMLEKRLPR